jgi:hypothetical protein
VIVRLMGEGQFRVDDELRTRLNELDDEALGALERDDEAALDDAIGRMWKLVESDGSPLPPEDLSPSDVIIPPPDLTLEETRRLFSEDGLIPDLPG